MALTKKGKNGLKAFYFSPHSLAQLELDSEASCSRLLERVDENYINTFSHQMFSKDTKSIWK